MKYSYVPELSEIFETNMEQTAMLFAIMYSDSKRYNMRIKDLILHSTIWSLLELFIYVSTSKH